MRVWFLRFRGKWSPISPQPGNCHLCWWGSDSRGEVGPSGSWASQKGQLRVGSRRHGPGSRVLESKVMARAELDSQLGNTHSRARASSLSVLLLSRSLFSSQEPQETDLSCFSQPCQPAGSRCPPERGQEPAGEGCPQRMLTSPSWHQGWLRGQGLVSLLVPVLLLAVTSPKTEQASSAALP